MAALLVVRSRKVSAERQKGQVQGGNPNWGAGGNTREVLVTPEACAYVISPYQTPPLLGRERDALWALTEIILNL